MRNDAMKTMDERSHAFVVRLWEERRDIDGAEPAWRGSVEDVRTGARHYFVSLPELSDYLERQSGMTRQPERWWSRLLASLPGTNRQRIRNGNGHNDRS
jgi:hypothetical protein